MGTPRRITAERSGRFCLINQDEIDSLDADGSSVNVRAAGETFALRGTLAQAESILEPGKFLRIHRSIILNAEKIRIIERGNRGAYVITLKGGEQFTSGRTYRAQIREYLCHGRVRTPSA